MKASTITFIGMVLFSIAVGICDGFAVFLGFLGVSVVIYGAILAIASSKNYF